MDQSAWDGLVKALRGRSSVERAVGAAEALQRTATVEDVPRLLTLLKDDSFFVREAAAWPLSALGVTAALPDLLEALHRGFLEGHDNDGLGAALVDLAEMKGPEAAIVLEDLLRSERPHLREHALWLLEFCTNGRDA